MTTPEMAAYDAFIAKQNEIFGNFERATEQFAIDGQTQRDKGVEAQGAFLVAWRIPELDAQVAADFALEVQAKIPSIAYGAEDIHTTLSDYGLEPEFWFDEHDLVQIEILDNLVEAVKGGLDRAGRTVRQETGILYRPAVTNGSTVIMPGSPNIATWEINEAVKAVAVEERYTTLKGAWGAHMTLNRFLEEGTIEDRPLFGVHPEVPSLGWVQPSSIDVGYFQTDPTAGFKLTTVESFEL